MNITPLVDLTYNSTNLAEDTTPAWSATSGYAVDTIRQYNNHLYQALGAINPLCEYVHDDNDPLKPHHTYDTLTQTTQTNTAVRCELNVTVVYNKDNNKYYIFDNASGATLDTGNFYFVDFTTQDPETPVNFTEVLNYRYEVYNPETTPLKWLDLGFTNKYKCLDKSLSSQTENAGDITMSFVVQKIDSIYLFRVQADSITIKVTDTDSSTVIYEETTPMIVKNGATWYDYFFTEYSVKTKLVSPVPLSFNALVEITLSSTTTAKVGLVGIGRSNYVGGTLYGSSMGIIDFSTNVTNDSGETYVQQGNYKLRNSLNVDVPTGLTDTVFNKLVEYRAIPVVFENDEFDNLVLYGIYKNFELVVSTPTISKMSIQLESLI